MHNPLVMMYNDDVIIGRFQRLMVEVILVMRVPAVPMVQVCIVHSR